MQKITEVERKTNSKLKRVLYVRVALGKMCTNDEQQITKDPVGYRQDRMAEFGQLDHQEGYH